MCCNSSCRSTINLAGILNKMTCVYEFIPTKDRSNYSSVIITILLHWSGDEEHALSSSSSSSFLLLPFALQPVVGFDMSNNVFPFFPIYH